MTRFLAAVFLIFAVLAGLAGLTSGSTPAQPSPWAASIIGSGGLPPPACDPAPCKPPPRRIS